MPDINVLPDTLINQIAAGEVVERPASVVKELVENALDAGASQIEVHIEAGGKKRIRVVDNGSGMNERNLSLCIDRHATSKIQTMDDLTRIQTMGFRGEAMPAIASVSRFEVTTLTEDGDTALLLKSHGGETPTIKPAAGKAGTTITVDDLFFNTPARRKFLKTDRTEFNHILDVMTRFALTYPHQHWSLFHDGKKVFQLSPSELNKRITQLLGIDGNNLLPLAETQRGPFMAYGFITAPEQHYSHRSNMYLFVNRRHIKQANLIQAVVQTAREFLPAGRYPGAVIYLDCDPAAVDVNVHPAKTEVKFEDQQSAYGLLRRITKDALSAYKQVDPLRQGDESTPDEDASGIKQVSIGFGASTGSHGFIEPDVPPPPTIETTQVSVGVGSAQSDITPSQYDTSTDQHAINIGVNESAPGPSDADDATQASPLPTSDDVDYADVFQIDTTYIVMHYRGGILVLDQHAVHEKLVFLKLREHAAQKGLSQRLLSPEIVPVTPKVISRIDDYLEVLNHSGFEAALFGELEVAIYAVPTYIKEAKIGPLLRDVFNAVEPKRDLETLRDEILERIACHGSVRAGRRLDPSSMRALVKDYLTMENSATCPHGRPVAKYFPGESIAKWFDR